MTAPTNDQVRVQSFDMKYAGQVGDLFRAVYGDEYPIKTYYHPEALQKAIEKRDLFPALAINAEDRVVGVGNMYRSAPFDNIYEVGAGLVLPEYRRLNLFTRMYDHIYRHIAPEQGVALLYGEDVCNHVYTQKMQAALGFAPMALEVDLMPAEAYAKEKASEGRVASLWDCRVYLPGKGRVFLPPAYDEQLRWLYSGLDDQRELTVADQSPPVGSSSRIDSQHFEFAAVSRLTVHEVGADFAAALGRAEDKALAKGAVVEQVWLRLDHPWSGAAVEVLRGRGFFLGGLLPRWFDVDGMLMQKVNAEPNWAGIKLFLERAKRIFDLVRADWQDSLTRQV